MSVKNEVLKLLEETRGTFLSGAKMAGSLGVSRTAIWKAVRTLQAEGHNIDAITNKGYMLCEDSNMLSKECIELYLKSSIPLHFFHSTDSTNKRATALALEGAKSGTCVVARHQSAGRGRLGRSFYSPDRQGIYLSVILKPDFDISKAVLITAAASVAVKRAIQTVCGVCPQIKWVNDLYLDGKKICGILTEAITDFESGQIASIVVGIGINCSCEGFPDEIRDIAGGIPGNYSKNALAAEVINQLLDIASDIEARSFIEEYRQSSMITGKNINVIKTGREPEPAFAEDIDNNGALIVRYPDGRRETLTTGEVSIRLR